MDSSFHNVVIFTEHKRNIMEAKKKKKRALGLRTGLRARVGVEKSS